jgi:hypothetical protein
MLQVPSLLMFKYTRDGCETIQPRRVFEVETSD